MEVPCYLEVFTAVPSHLEDSMVVLGLWDPVMDIAPVHSKESMYPVRSVDFMAGLPTGQDTAMEPVIKDKFYCNTHVCREHFNTGHSSSSLYNTEQH
jgi:hypothetical protein